MEWYIGMKVIMNKVNKDGEVLNEADPRFTSNPYLASTLNNFDDN